MGFRMQQTLTSLRRRGVALTLLKIQQTIVKERTYKVPMRERVWLAKNGYKHISFVVYGFENKSVADRLQFLSDKVLLQLCGVNGQRGIALQNKLVFYRTLALVPERVSAPQLIALVRRGEIIQATPPYRRISLDELRSLGGDFFLKPIGGARGRGVKRAATRDIGTLLGQLQSTGDYLIVHTVKQSEYSTRIFPDSFNTVRAVAMRAPGTREIFVPCAVHRFGVAETVPVDNWSRGGLSCDIDVASGLMGPGIRHPYYTQGRLVEYKTHPNSGQPIDGASVRCWPEALRVLTELMNLFPDLEFAGWDLLSTDDGWCVIEGNHMMDVDLLQVHRGLLSDDRVRKFVSYHCRGMVS